MSDGRTMVRFDSGEVHRYKHESLHKLTLLQGREESHPRWHVLIRNAAVTPTLTLTLTLTRLRTRTRTRTLPLPLT